MTPEKDARAVPPPESTPVQLSVPPLAPESPEPRGDSSPVLSASSASPLPPELEAIRERVVEILRNTFDPEIPVNIYELGLVYELDVQPTGIVRIRMTLTSPMCPVAESLPPEVEAKVATVDGVTGVKLDLVWEPPWTPDMMTPDAKLLLNLP